MTTPIVEAVITIPLIIEKEMCEPMTVHNDFDDSGFPFDRDFDNRSPRGDSFQSQLDDIVQRHPDLAGHFHEFPFRSSGRRQRPARSSPFDSFGAAGFSFGRDPFQEYYSEEIPQQQQHQQQQQQPETSNNASNQKHREQNTQTDETDSSSSNNNKEESSGDQQRGRRPNNIQQSQTVDLGQKQEPAVNDRNQRSMSAPPSQSRTGGTGQRFVSSINIPIGGMGDMGAQQSQQTQQQQNQEKQQQTTNSKPTERVIPIHVEGRDEPVVPKHSGPSFTSSSQQQPQPERIFGQRPSQFTQFVGSQRPFGGQQQPQQQQRPSEEAMKQQQQQYQQQQQQKFQKKQEEAPQEAPAQPTKVNTPIDLIKSIQVDVSALMAQVEKFSGQPRDKQYLYLDEMLTRNLIKLDDIDTQGQENIRQARKEAIKCIQECISILEAKAAANVPKAAGEAVQSDEKMDVETKKEVESSSGDDVTVPQEKEPEKMEGVENKEEKVEEAKKVEETKAAGEEEKKNEDVKAEGDSLAAASAAENVVKK